MGYSPWGHKETRLSEQQIRMDNVLTVPKPRSSVSSFEHGTETIQMALTEKRK